VTTADVIKEATDCGGLIFSTAVSGLCYSWLADCRDRFVLRMMADRSKHRQLQFYCSERLIGSIRRECVDHIIVLGEMHLRRVLKSYADYYNCVRTHRSLKKDAPVSRAVQRAGEIRSRAILGGLHHHYGRA
jgi:Integrase core domain